MKKKKEEPKPYIYVRYDGKNWYALFEENSILDSNKLFAGFSEDIIGSGSTPEEAALQLILDTIRHGVTAAIEATKQLTI